MENSFVLIIAGVVILMLLFTIRVMLTMANVSARRDAAYIQSPYPYAGNGGVGGEWVMIILVVALGIFGYSWLSNSTDNTLDDKKPSSAENVAQFGGNKPWYEAAKEEEEKHLNEAPVPSLQKQVELNPDAPAYYCIQIGAGEVEAFAYEDAEKWRKQYHDVVHVIRTEEPLPFKIVLGRFADEFSAKQQNAKLGLKGSFIRKVGE